MEDEESVMTGLGEPGGRFFMDTTDTHTAQDLTDLDGQRSPTTTGFYTAGSAGMRPAATDNWATPEAFFLVLDAEFHFTLDVSASAANHKAADWFGLDHPDPARRNALDCDWVAAANGGTVFMNPPYGKTIGHWTAKAAATAAAGVTVVCVLPARTDTRWFHDTCVGHELRFVKGRLCFGAGTAPAPFPSVVVAMRPPAEGDEPAARQVYTTVDAAKGSAAKAKKANPRLRRVK